MNVCGNCLLIKPFNSFYEFGFCRKHKEIRLYTSYCNDFKDSYTLKELKQIEDERKRLKQMIGEVKKK